MRRLRGYRGGRARAVIAITKKRFPDAPPVWEFRAESTASIAFRYGRVSAAATIGGKRPGHKLIVLMGSIKVIYGFWARLNPWLKQEFVRRAAAPADWQGAKDGLVHRRRSARTPRGNKARNSSIPPSRDGGGRERSATSGTDDPRPARPP